MSPLSVCVVFGTRPEAIKLMPVVRALQRKPGEFATHVIATAQHRELLDMVIGDLGVVPDVDLDLMRLGQSPADFLAGALGPLGAVFAKRRPQWVIVQGDTTTTLAGALAAFWHGASICHVEAGLRSGARRNPFPEEMHRRLVTQLADLHCAPTVRAREALLAEGVDEQRVVVTGNTAVDALLWVLGGRPEYGNIAGGMLKKGDRHLAGVPDAGERSAGSEPVPVFQIVVTVHRRENFGRPLQEIIEAVRRVAVARPDVKILWPVHPNPNVAAAVRSGLAGCTGVELVEPLPYREFIHALSQARLVLTDSGGVQEEVALLGRPALVLRSNTERPEAIDSGWAELVEIDADGIARRVCRVLEEPRDRLEAREPTTAFGSGDAAELIATSILQANSTMQPVCQAASDPGRSGLFEGRKECGRANSPAALDCRSQVNELLGFLEPAVEVVDAELGEARS